MYLTACDQLVAHADIGGLGGAYVRLSHLNVADIGKALRPE